MSSVSFHPSNVRLTRVIGPALDPEAGPAPPSAEMAIEPSHGHAPAGSVAAARQRLRDARLRLVNAGRMLDCLDAHAEAFPAPLGPAIDDALAGLHVDLSRARREALQLATAIERGLEGWPAGRGIPHTSAGAVAGRDPFRNLAPEEDQQ